MKINDKGNLEIGGVDCTDLARDFDTPLYVLDEAGFRQNCASFKNAFAKYGDSLVIYASKTLSCLSVYAMINEEGLGLDVVSGGEIYTALKAGFPMEKIYFHGNNKSREEITFAIESNIGRIVVDNFSELDLLTKVCDDLNVKQDIMLRITPGIEAHTHEHIKTGQIDSKFGFTLTDGQAMEGVKAALNIPNVNLVGLHCHIGSQIFEMNSFKHATLLMMDFCREVKNATGYEFDELDMGGGFGIFYYHGDEPCDPEEWAEAVMVTVIEKAKEIGIKVPKVVVEPGRSIAGPAGVTLYTVGTFKEIPEVRKYVAVDGGMTDNLRPALYDANYIAMVGNKADKEPKETVSIAGKCCESGDMLIWDIDLPKLDSGDILVTFATGAYNYSMANNYNKIPKPAMVLVNNGSAELIIKRETYEDLVRNEILLDKFK
ncbi:diaminopimelate decarboxylase [Candidatus Syntrophocurvum alkaliphilum]|nr:diaminopimelate decarboxylase [Candidatus Syntrophocurvum alkaliphilum]